MEHDHRCYGKLSSAWLSENVREKQAVLPTTCIANNALFASDFLILFKQKQLVTKLLSN
jgi:hypothetical protein